MKAKGGGQWAQRELYTLRTPKRVYFVFKDLHPVKTKQCDGKMKVVWRAVYRSRLAPSWTAHYLPLSNYSEHSTQSTDDTFPSKNSAMAACRAHQKSNGDFWPKSKWGEER